MSLRLERALAIEAESVREGPGEVVLPIATKEEWRLHTLHRLSRGQVLIRFIFAASLLYTAGMMGTIVVSDLFTWWHEVSAQRGVSGGVREVTQPSVLVVLAVLGSMIVIGCRLLLRNLNWMVLRVRRLRYAGRLLLRHRPHPEADWGIQLFLGVSLIVIWILVVAALWHNLGATWGQTHVLFDILMFIAAPTALLVLATIGDSRSVFLGLARTFPTLGLLVTSTVRPPQCRVCVRRVQERPRWIRCLKKINWRVLRQLRGWMRELLPLEQFVIFTFAWYLFLFLMGAMLNAPATGAARLATTGAILAVLRMLASGGPSVFDGFFEEVTWPQLRTKLALFLLAAALYGHHRFLIWAIDKLKVVAIGEYDSNSMCCFLLICEGVVLYMVWRYRRGVRGSVLWKPPLGVLAGNLGFLKAATGLEWGWDVLIVMVGLAWLGVKALRQMESDSEVRA